MSRRKGEGGRRQTGKRREGNKKGDGKGGGKGIRKGGKIGWGR